MNCTHGDTVGSVRVTKFDCLCAHNLEIQRRRIIRDLVRNQVPMPQKVAQILRDHMWELYE